MTNRLRAFTVALLAFAALTLQPRAGSAAQARGQTGRLRCTKRALAALKPAPELDYECAEREDDNLKSAARQAAMKDYLQELEETFNDDEWWATPVDELNACSIAKDVRALNEDESREYRFKIALYGDQTTRLIAVTDPCIHYSYSTLNAYVLERAGGRVVATQVIDAFFTRFDASLDMKVAQLGGERLILIERNGYDGGPVAITVTAAAYTINPRTHRPVPKKIFKSGRELTSEMAWNAPPFFDFDGRSLPDTGWRQPVMVRQGRLAPRFQVAYPTRRGLRHDTYVWDGRYYRLAR
jgi:hypothetical protein